MNRPEFFNTFNRPQNLNNWKRVKPAFVFNIGSTINKNGIENMYLPATTMAIARTTDKIITNDLINFEIFLLEVLANQFNIKYIKTKITSVIKKKFM